MLRILEDRRVQHFLVKVWVGGADHRWNTQSVDVIASSTAEATRIVAEDLGLPAGSWDGDNPPFELAVLPLEEMPLVAQTLPDGHGGASLLAALKAQYHHVLGHAVGNGRQPVRSHP